jgi:hypothetical protein
MAESQSEFSLRVTRGILRSQKLGQVNQDVANQWFAESQGFGSWGEYVMSGTGPVIHQGAFPNLSQKGQYFGRGQEITQATGALVSTAVPPAAEFLFAESKAIIPAAGIASGQRLLATINVNEQMLRRKVWFGIDFDGSYRLVLRGKFNGEVKSEFPFEFSTSGFFTGSVLIKFSPGNSIAPTGTMDDEAIVWKTPTVGNFQKLLPYRSHQMIDKWEFILLNVIPRVGISAGDAFLAGYSEFPY